MSTVQSVERAFAILELVATHPDGIGVTEIANQTELPKSTVSRLLSTLEGVEAVEHVSDPEGYCIGSGIIALASHAPYPQHLITVARSWLLELAQATGETVNLSLPEIDQVQYVDQIDSQYHLQIQDWTGRRFPLHVVADGKLFLAHWPEEHLAQYLNRPLQCFTPKTITDPEALCQQLIKIREQGFAWSYGESEPEIVGVSAPIRDKTEHVIAAIGVWGPAFRFPPEGKADKVTRLVVEAGNKITERIQGLASFRAYS